MKKIPFIIYIFCLYVGLPISFVLATLGYFLKIYSQLLYYSVWSCCICIVLIVISYLIDCIKD